MVSQASLTTWSAKMLPPTLSPSFRPSRPARVVLEDSPAFSGSLPVLSPGPVPKEQLRGSSGLGTWLSDNPESVTKYCMHGESWAGPEWELPGQVRGQASQMRRGTEGRIPLHHAVASQGAQLPGANTDLVLAELSAWRSQIRTEMQGALGLKLVARGA